MNPDDRRESGFLPKYVTFLGGIECAMVNNIKTPDRATNAWSMLSTAGTGQSCVWLRIVLA